LQLMAPRPILPQDFAALSKSVAGVWRAIAIDLYQPGINELQSLSLSGTTGGTFTLTYSGQTTGNIAWNASPAAIVTALEGLSNIAVGDVAVTGGPLPSQVVIEFKANLGNMNVGAITGSATLLTGTAPVINLATTRAGAAPNTNKPRAVTVVPIDSSGEPVSAVTQDAVDNLLQTEREINFEVYVMDPTYTEIEVDVELSIFPSFTAEDVELRVESDIQTYLDPATWAIPPEGTTRDWQMDPILDTVY
jgi:hypothetical protein